MQHSFGRGHPALSCLTVASSTQESLHGELMFAPVIDFQAVIINSDLDHLADETRWERVDIVLGVYGAPGGEPDLNLGKFRDSVGCDRLHHVQLFGESPRSESVHLLYDPG